MISISIWTEKKKGCGEDSEPLLLDSKGYSGVVGVFDGMGGSGSMRCKWSEDGEIHTMAYVASRIVRKAIQNDFSEKEDWKDIDASSITHIVHSVLEWEKSQNDTQPSLLKSNLIREYPTTLALITAEKEEESSNFLIKSYWAGDSKNYLWTQDEFYQISQDDLKGDIDPLQNLHRDASLSNCICADRDFTIHQNLLRVPAPFIILSATDGCFGYFPTPMHFENLLREGLEQAENEEEWKENIQKEIDEVTGDDTSLALLVFGIEDFQEMKTKFLGKKIEDFPAIVSLEKKVSDLEGELNLKRKKLEEKIQGSWEKYRGKYMEFSHSADENVQEVPNQPYIPKEENKQDMPPSPQEDEKKNFMKRMILFIRNLFRKRK